MPERFVAAFFEAERLLREFRVDPAVLSAMTETTNLIADCFRNRGRVLACGNGGSMTDAMHFAEEFSGRFDRDRRPYPALALSDPAHLTCVANDFGFEHVFSRQVEAFGHTGDVLLALSTSGASPNILRALEAARARNMNTIGFLGKGGGPAAALCDVVLLAPGDGSDRIQELHMMALHMVIEAIEVEMEEG